MQACPVPRKGEQSSNQMQSRTSCLTLEDGEDARQTGTGNFPTCRLKNGRKQRFQTLHAGFPQICRQSATVQIVPGKLHCVDTGKDPCACLQFIAREGILFIARPGQRQHLGLWVPPAERQWGQRLP